MDSLNNSFTLKFTIKDGKLKIYTKGMPDTRSFGGKHLTELPLTHHAGLFALSAVIEKCKSQGIEIYGDEIVMDK